MAIPAAKVSQKHIIYKGGIRTVNIILKGENIPRVELIKQLDEFGIDYEWVGNHAVYANPIIKVSDASKQEFIEKLEGKGLFLREKFN